MNPGSSTSGDTTNPIMITSPQINDGSKLESVKWYVEAYAALAIYADKPPVNERTHVVTSAEVARPFCLAARKLATTVTIPAQIKHRIASGG
jgi:hypothetical protein